MLKLQSTPPLPVPVESCSAVVSAVCRSASVFEGTNDGLADHTAESSATLTLCASERSTSVKASVPAGTELVVSSALDPVTPGCSATVADSGPLVTVTASLAPVTVTDTVCVEVVEASLTATL